MRLFSGIRFGKNGIVSAWRTKSSASNAGEMVGVEEVGEAERREKGARSS